MRLKILKIILKIGKTDSENVLRLRGLQALKNVIQPPNALSPMASNDKKLTEKL
jgi:hypothetical protein